jgi:hypothetical protein
LVDAGDAASQLAQLVDERGRAGASIPDVVHPAPPPPPGAARTVSTLSAISSLRPAP